MNLFWVWLQLGLSVGFRQSIRSISGFWFQTLFSKCVSRSVSRFQIKCPVSSRFLFNSVSFHNWIKGLQLGLTLGVFFFLPLLLKTIRPPNSARHHQRPRVLIAITTGTNLSCSSVILTITISSNNLCYSATMTMTELFLSCLELLLSLGLHWKVIFTSPRWFFLNHLSLQVRCLSLQHILGPRLFLPHEKIRTRSRRQM